ncbi:hypothetical protein ABPG74_008431 [Tetrahymena malaccensis]
MDNNYHFWGNGDRQDVSLSYEDYYSILDCLLDEKLSPQGLMKFKNLHEVSMYGVSYVPLYCFPVAYGISHMLTGKVRRGHSGYRNLWSLMSVVLPFTCWYAYTTPIPRRLYTEIICSNNADGAYVRNRIKQQKPGIWRKLSQQLYNKNFRFPELNQDLTATEFPLDYVAPHKF